MTLRRRLDGPVQRILITSGPTRQYLDPVRYLTNASSGKMGAALADAALRIGHKVVVLSGPVSIEYPSAATVIDVLTTDDLLRAAEDYFPDCDGLIGAAAPCDYRPRRVAASKMTKTGGSVQIDLIETPDVVAHLGCHKRSDQWVVGFALETEDHRFRAIAKMQRKHCDLMVSNGPSAIDSDHNSIEIIADDGRVLLSDQGPKSILADQILKQIELHCMGRSRNQGVRDQDVVVDSVAIDTASIDSAAIDTAAIDTAAIDTADHESTNNNTSEPSPAGDRGHDHLNII